MSQMQREPLCRLGNWERVLGCSRNWSFCPFLSSSVSLTFLAPSTPFALSRTTEQSWDQLQHSSGLSRSDKIQRYSLWLRDSSTSFLVPSNSNALRIWLSQSLAPPVNTVNWAGIWIPKHRNLKEYWGGTSICWISKRGRKLHSQSSLNHALPWIWEHTTLSRKGELSLLWECWVEGASE